MNDALPRYLIDSGIDELKKSDSAASRLCGQDTLEKKNRQQRGRQTVNLQILMKLVSFWLTSIRKL
jgi:hypothetical protein